MNRLLFGLLLGGILTGCTALPTVLPAPSGQFRADCGGLFPRESREYVHAIEITLPGGHKSMMMGVTRTCQKTQGLHCAIMGIEGLVIFEARDEDGRITIDRGIPPFDSADFARGMMDDIRLIFYEPPGQEVRAGLSQTGEPLCRYLNGENTVTDLISHPGGGRSLNRYVSNRRTRTVQAGAESGAVLPDGRIVPRHIRLQAFGAVRYTLDMTLVQTALIPASVSSE